MDTLILNKMKILPVFCVSIVFLLLMQLSTVNAQQIKRLDGSTINADSLDNKILFLMDQAKVKGLELAVFDQNEVVYKRLLASVMIITSR